MVFTQILEARRRIAGQILHTPMRPATGLGARLGVPVWLKYEHQQRTGSFKLRGATNALLSLNRAQRDAGVIAASTGNHGRALAYAARQAGVHAVICMSALVPRNKVAAVEALGAEVRIVGVSQDDAQAEVDRLVRSLGMTVVPPFDMPEVIAGQGTLGLEMLEDTPDIACIVVPLSGGGLIAGVALAAKTLNPSIRIVGVTMERGAAMQASLAAGRPLEVAELPTLADSLGGGIGLDNRYSFAMVRNLVDEVVLVSEAEIVAGIRTAYFEEGEVIEGAAAVGIAALDSGKVKPGGPVAVVLSGKNIDMALHARIIAGQTPEPGGAGG
ncbi:MAG: hydroxyectoine utilization dehydratase EutB [Devosia sp.]